MTSATSKTVFMFKISLKNLKPEIWRRVLIPGDYTFKDLHNVIIKVMGWSNFHMHRFTMKHPITEKEIEIGGVGDLGYGDYLWLPESTKIAHYFMTPKQKAMYEYDFGSPWYHILLFEKTIPAEPGQKYPQCVGGKRATPPEEDPGSDYSEPEDDYFDHKLINFDKWDHFELETDYQALENEENLNSQIESSTPLNATSLDAVKIEPNETSELADDSKTAEQNLDAKSPPRKRRVIRLESQTSATKVKCSPSNANTRNAGTVAATTANTRNARTVANSRSVGTVVVTAANTRSAGTVALTAANTHSAGTVALTMANGVPEYQPSQSGTSIMSRLESDTDEDIEDAYGKYVASQMRLIDDLEAREELRIEIQKAIKNYRFRKS